MFESYGCAMRSYAFAAKTGRLPKTKLDPKFFDQCENEIIANANDQSGYARDNAYGTSFPIETKRFRGAGWYFSTDHAFDLAVACQLDFPQFNDPRPKFIEAIIGNVNYEAGCNPVNVSYISGAGWKRPREMVNHYAMNDRRVLPPSGLVWGNIQEGFPYLDIYAKELGTLTFPSDGDEKKAYPFYDRWGDSFNTSQEFVTVNVARSLACASFLMGKTSLTNQTWKAVPATISFSGKPLVNQKATAQLNASGINLKKSRSVWEMAGAEPTILSGSSFVFTPSTNGEYWIEVETSLPDGRRMFGVTNFVVGPDKK